MNWSLAKIICQNIKWQRVSNIYFCFRKYQGGRFLGSGHFTMPACYWNSNKFVNKPKLIWSFGTFFYLEEWLNWSQYLEHSVNSYCVNLIVYFLSLESMSRAINSLTRVRSYLGPVPFNWFKTVEQIKLSCLYDSEYFHSLEFWSSLTCRTV